MDEREDDTWEKPEREDGMLFLNLHPAAPVFIYNNGNNTLFWEYESAFLFKKIKR